MDKVKIKNVKTGAIEEVKKEIAGDYIGTKEWVLLEEKETKPVFSKNEK
jgi:hypothetical protein